VHRDLKPENIVVKGGNDGPLMLKVLDFGIAKSMSSATAVSTSPGQGTPLWTAPEQTRMDDVPNPTADVWALGLLTFFVLTGKIYWLHANGKSSMVQLSMELVRNPIAPPSQRLVELGLGMRMPSEFDAWFSHCVNRDPQARFVDANAAYHALMSVLARRG
jgi:serine/threonine protein kinase